MAWFCWRVGHWRSRRKIRAKGMLNGLPSAAIVLAIKCLSDICLWSNTGSFSYFHFGNNYPSSNVDGQLIAEPLTILYFGDSFGFPSGNWGGILC